MCVSASLAISSAAAYAALEKEKEVALATAAADKSSMKSEMEKTTAEPVKTSNEQDEYFSGALGRFFLDIGLSLVQEYVQGDLLRVQKRKVNKGTKISDPSLSVGALAKGELDPLTESLQDSVNSMFVPRFGHNASQERPISTAVSPVRPLPLQERIATGFGSPLEHSLRSRLRTDVPLRLPLLPV